MKKVFIVLVAVAVLAGGYIVYSRGDNENDSQSTARAGEDQASEQTGDKPAGSTADPANFTFEQPKKSAHYVSNKPEHGAVLKEAPREISLTFNFDLSSDSTISVTKDGQEVSSGNAIVSGNKLVLTKALKNELGSGLYTVTYNACWPDGSCHDGSFQFGVR